MLGEVSYTISIPAAGVKIGIQKVQVSSKRSIPSSVFLNFFCKFLFCARKSYLNLAPTLRVGCCAATHLTYEDPERLELRRPGMGV